MRAFLALNLNEEIKNKYSNIFRINENIAEANYVSKNKMHITLSFFNNIDENKIELLKECVKTPCPYQFNVKFERISYFTNKFNDINIVFIKSESKELENYVKKLRNNLNENNINYDKKDFKSHITLARIKKIYDQNKLKEKIENIKFESELFNINSISLYSSDFINYTEIFRIDF